MSVLSIFLASATVLLALAAFWQRRERVRLEREHRIRAHVFPGKMLLEVTKVYPHLDLKDLQLVARALRQFFLVRARAPKGMVVMPSKAVDALWHAFILDTRAYGAFCQAAFGTWFHHIPEDAMRGRDPQGTALWRTWRLACLEENIDPGKPTRLPLLFGIDAKLAIPGTQPFDPRTLRMPKDPARGCGGGCGGSGSDGGCGGGCGGS